ncbi:siderophore-interacting protein [Larsenimonas salina]|uniref:siderophore-interacting protein n=1 Tax=Larsenimonas salina TaxID=1295565 RepID=UPI002072CE79|nr:siderophore-interacting protein [Larsenimonas salina]MCM5704296.1 siderophore-interacting protein [Larsenimonas salina]
MTTSTHTAAAPAPTRKKRPPRLLEVMRTEPLSEHMVRIFLGGEALAGFPDNAPGGHLKVFLPRDHQSTPRLPELTADGPIWPEPEERPITRTYSVRQMDNARGELAIDFVLHGDNGPASRWAARATQGDLIGISGPGGPLPLLKPADQYLLAGDLSALPAMVALCEALPGNASGHVLIEAIDERDYTDFEHPAGLNIHWLYRGAQAAGESTRLIEAARALSFDESVTVFGWAGGENSAVLALRDHFRNTLALPKGRFYAVPYWKDQFSEERYHQERHRIMDENE